MANHHPTCRLDSATARKLFKIKGAHAANAAMRARGIVPGSAATAARMRYAAERRAAKEAGKVPEVGSYPPRESV